jgi:hypothetical protein
VDEKRKGATDDTDDTDEEPDLTTRGLGSPVEQEEGTWSP